MVCTRGCLSNFSFFQGFFSCCVSQNVLGDPPQCGWRVVETSVGTSRELKVSSQIPSCQNENKDCRLSDRKVPSKGFRIAHGSVHLSQYQPRPRSPAQWLGSPGRVTVPILIILRILLFISFSIQYAIRESSGKSQLILYLYWEAEQQFQGWLGLVAWLLVSPAGPRHAHLIKWSHWAAGDMEHGTLQRRYCNLAPWLTTVCDVGGKNECPFKIANLQILESWREGQYNNVTTIYVS